MSRQARIKPIRPPAPRARMVIRDGSHVYLAETVVPRFRLVSASGVPLALASTRGELRKFAFPGATIEELEEAAG